MKGRRKGPERGRTVPAAILAVILVTGILWGTPVGAANLSEVDQATVAAKQQEIEEAQQEQENIKSSISDLESIVEELQSKKSDLSAYIQSVDSSISELTDKISGYESLIAQKEAEIAGQEAELEAALAQEEEQYASMCVRIQYMYEMETSSYLETILSAGSFADMLNQAEYVEQLASYDYEMLQTYILQRQYVELVKEQLEEEQATLEAAREALEEEEASLEALRSQKTQDLAAYQSDISSTEASITELEEDLEYQTSLIEQLEAEIEKITSSVSYDGGTFCWPCPNYTAISSDFGYRTDPFTGETAYHNGVDMAAPEGSSILAAYDGTVVAATYNWSMGNYVMIDHGDGLYTIYMHASKLYVSAGDTVSKGDLIAAVGTTGRSTGNHLHFSVRLNGSYVSPWDYL
ncbi:MAG: peptidoglycan DD-metalloendopeptidase family protein [Lachnospiraceae bacterium]|nr:peptidoglycan DD-metalloendopeptidase family protein [Lachnospiraceae bacterium]